MTYETFDEFVLDLQRDDSYWVEAAKVKFAVDLAALMDLKGVSKADFARRIGKSPAYVTKVLRGDSNCTLETMVRLVRAIGGTLHQQVCDANHGARFVTWVNAKAVQADDHWGDRQGEVGVIAVTINEEHHEAVAIAA